MLYVFIEYSECEYFMDFSVKNIIESSIKSFWYHLVLCDLKKNHIWKKSHWGMFKQSFSKRIIFKQEQMIKPWKHSNIKE